MLQHGHNLSELCGSHFFVAECPFSYKTNGKSQVSCLFYSDFCASASNRYQWRHYVSVVCESGLHATQFVSMIVSKVS